MTSPTSPDLPEGERASARAAEHLVHRRTRRRRTVIIGTVAAAVVLATVGAIFLSQTASPVSARTEFSAAGAQSKPVSQSGLPMISYAAVVPGLLPATSKDLTGDPTSYSISRDTPVYGNDKTNPIGFIPQQDFSHQATVIVGIRSSGDWTLVLTTARNATPSDGHPSAAQTMGWVRTDDLIDARRITTSITLSISSQKLTIRQSRQPDQVFAAGIGTPGTPTPEGVTGFIQQRYTDPSQGTGGHPINLTTLHSAVADQLFQGNVGGVIGIHYNEDNTGAVSHGCIRLGEDGINAVNALPLGTLVTITN